MFKDHFIHLFKYNDWATKEAANSVKILNMKEDRIVELLSHIVLSQKIWFNRVLGRRVVIDPWQKLSPDECIEQSTEITDKWINLLEKIGEKELEKRINYKNNKGEESENSVEDITLHIINHSTYHRAQIAQLIRQSGSQPAKTDYILYQRTLRS